MNKILLFIFIICFFETHAQNYRVFEWGAEHLYESTNEIVGIRVDSAIVSGSDSIFYNYFIINQYPDSLGCIGPYTPSWFGKGIIIPSDSVIYILNNNNDSLLIRPLDSVGSHWNFYSDTGNYKVTATISNVSVQSINGISDSVMEIVLREFNNNQSFQGLIDNRILKLSKNHGFLQAISFLNFPDDSTYFTLNDNLFLTDSNVYNFDVGDTIVYSYYVLPQYFSPCPPAYYPNRTTIAILTKSIIGNMYVYDVWEQLNTGYIYYDSVNVPHANITITANLNTISYSNVNTRIFSGMPDEAIIDQNNMVSRYKMSKWPGACGKVTATFLSADLFYDTIMNCIPQPFEPDQNTLEYSIGLGCTNSSQCIYHQNGASNVYHLDAYSKGNNHCGSIYIYNQVEEALSNNLLTIYPNPITGDELLWIKNKSAISRIILFDQVGRVAFVKDDLNDVNSIDLKSVIPGIYLCRFYFMDGLSVTKIIVKN
jgi:hypothetical protein